MIKPSHREKKRYVKFQILPKEMKLEENEVEKAIIKECHDFLGDYGMAKAGIVFLREKFNKEKKEGIIRVNNKYVNKLKMALGLIKKINNKKITIHIPKVSGIIKKLQVK